jgi:hypothetical protein
MPDLRYSLIVSQYYHSRHMFIVKIDENFIDNARKFACELMEYKRSSLPDDFYSSRGKYLGDLDPEYCGEKLRPRYNINDTGDIYFINFKYANRCMYEAFEYREDSRRESVGFKKKSVTDSIAEHHNRDRVKEILEKYFEIA